MIIAGVNTPLRGPTSPLHSQIPIFPERARSWTPSSPVPHEDVDAMNTGEHVEDPDTQLTSFP